MILPWMSLDTGLVIVVGVVGVIILVELFVLIYILRYRNKSKKLTPPEDIENHFPLISYQKLFNATNGFSSGNLIGKGKFAVVYKGTIDYQGASIVVAIKIFNLAQHGATKSFMVECDILRNIRHRNLVKVISACSSVNYQGNNFKALIYEYMVNHSLDDWLHPKRIDILEETNNNTSPRCLNLRQRLDIAIDVATAVDYLHNQCGVSSIIHCDLKPSNVLLDEDMVAHVGDFGLSKLLLNIIMSSHSSSLGVGGTIGYIPPEYSLGHKPSTSGDVYSFGILVLELFTGKRPTNDMFSGDKSLHSFVKDALPRRVMSILDPALLKSLNRMKTNKEIVLNNMIAILKLATICSSNSPRKRLGMKDVVQRLLIIRNQLLGARLQLQ